MLIPTFDYSLFSFLNRIFHKSTQPHIEDGGGAGLTNVLFANSLHDDDCYAAIALDFAAGIGIVYF